MISSSSHLLHTTPSFCNLPAQSWKFDFLVVSPSGIQNVPYCCSASARSGWPLPLGVASAGYRTQQRHMQGCGAAPNASRQPPGRGARDRRPAASIACSCLRRPHRRRRAWRPVREPRQRGGRCGQRNTTTLPAHTHSLEPIISQHVRLTRRVSLPARWSTQQGQENNKKKTTGTWKPQNV